MQFSDHPDYPKYKEVINKILIDGFTISKMPERHSFEVCPHLLAEEHYQNIHIDLMKYIGQRKKGLTVLGFLKPENVNSSKSIFVYKCACNQYFQSKVSGFINSKKDSILCCSDCHDKLNGFRNEFKRQTGLFISNEVSMSIFGIHDGSEITNFVNGYETFISKPIVNEELILNNQPIEVLQKLLDFNPDLDKKYFDTCPNTNDVIYLAKNQKIQNSNVKPLAILNLSLLSNVPHHLKVAKGQRIFRLTVLGIYQNYKPLKMRNVSYVCQCACGYYVNITHENLKTSSLPSCGRCDMVAKAVILKKHQIGEDITIKEAYEILNQDVSEVPAQITQLKTIKINSFSFEKKVYEPESSSLSYSKHFGKRYGLVTVKAKSRRFKEGNIKTPFVCVCVCGKDCVIAFDHIAHDKFNSCSNCASMIQTLMGANILYSIKQKSLDNHWIKFLKYHEVKTLDLDFYSVFKKWIELSQRNLSLDFKTTILHIIKDSVGESKF